MRYLLIVGILCLLNLYGECQHYGNQIQEIHSLRDSIITIDKINYWYPKQPNVLSPKQLFEKSEVLFKPSLLDSANYHHAQNLEKEFWIKFSVKSTVDLKDTILFTIGNHGKMELFQRDNSINEISSAKAGILWNYFNNSCNTNRYLFHITLKKGIVYDLFIKIYPEEFYSNTIIHPRIFHKNQLQEIFNKRSISQKRINDFYKGAGAILFFFFLVNFGQFLLIRDTSYLYYSLYLFSFFFYLDFKFNLVLRPASDFLLFYLLQGVWVFKLSSYFLLSAYTFYALFVYKFLNLKESQDSIEKYFSGMIKAFIAFSILLLISNSLPNQAFGLELLIWQGILVSIMILGGGALFFLYKQKQSLSRFIFWGTLFFTIGVSLGFLVSLGIIKVPDSYPLLSIPFFYTATGILIEAIFFSIGLAYRTKSVELEKQLLAKEKEYEIAKTKLYTNITHEFRTPLTVIRGNANLILKNPKSKLEERVEGIRHYADTLKSLVDDLLDLSKLQAGREQISMNNGNIIEYIEYLVESFQSLAFSKRLSLSFHSEIDTLNMDFSKKGIQQVITNLIGNAIKFTPEYGSIKVELKTNNSQELEIKVIDTGVGIPESELNEIFKPFHRVESESTFEKIGTGLGLSIVKQLVENIDGAIVVKSMLNAGTTFFVTLKINNQTTPFSSNQVNEKSKNPKSFESKNIQNPTLGILPKVLVVEDNRDVNQYIQDLLIGSFTVVSATNGKIGLKKALEVQPDIIISDEMMPIMSGFEMIEKLKAEPATCNIPVIMLTARSSREEELRGLKLKVEAYLTKPLDEEKLLILLENLLEKSKTQQLEGVIYWNNKPVTNEFMKSVIEILEQQYSKADFKAFNLKYQLQKKGYGAERKTERAIKEHFSTTTAKLILSFRLEKSRTLLIAKPEISIPEIIDNIGLECDQSYFTRIYKEKFDITPGDERK